MNLEFPNPEPIAEGDDTNAGSAYIHTIPTELLSEILTLAHDGSLYFPLIITHIDSRFRSAAKSISKLWTIIDINIPLPIVAIYLEHSKLALLEVRMGVFDAAVMPERIQAFIDLVAPHRHRIASLSMTAFKRDFIVDTMVQQMLNNHLTEFSELRTLDTGLPGPVAGWSTL